MDHGVKGWVTDWSQMSHIGHIWIKDVSQDRLQRLQIGQRWITYGSRSCVTDGSYISHMWVKHCFLWVSNESQMNHTLIKLSNITFLIFFSKLINFWPRHNFATLWVRKMNVIFDQSEESNPVVSLTTGGSQVGFLLIGWWDNSLCLAFIYWVGWFYSEFRIYNGRDKSYSALDSEVLKEYSFVKYSVDCRVSWSRREKV